MGVIIFITFSPLKSLIKIFDSPEMADGIWHFPCKQSESFSAGLSAAGGDAQCVSVNIAESRGGPKFAVLRDDHHLRLT